MPDLSNIRDYLGWIIGRRVVDVTAGDPPGLPDNDDDAHFVVLHFDNGGTLDVPIGDEGFSYNNPAAAAADRGELCEDCQVGDAKLAIMRREYMRHRPGSRNTLDPSAARGDFDCAGPIDDSRIGDILFNPPVYRPKNPHYLKNHVNAPGTVRAWFRQMRAADFERDLLVNVAQYGVAGIDVLAGHSPRIWTLFDTQQVVDRETAVIGKIEGIDWGADPSYVERLKTDPDRRRHLVAGEWFGIGGQAAWDDTDYSSLQWLGLDRSTYPMFSSKVPPATGALTLETIRQPIGVPPCPRCGGARRVVPAPLSYIGPPSGSVIYHYARLLEADRRYVHPSHRVAMCDSCQHGEIRP